MTMTLILTPISELQSFVLGALEEYIAIKRLPEGLAVQEILHNTTPLSNDEIKELEHLDQLWNLTDRLVNQIDCANEYQLENHLDNQFEVQTKMLNGDWENVGSEETQDIRIPLTFKTMSEAKEDIKDCLSSIADMSADDLRIRDVRNNVIWDYLEDPQDIERNKLIQIYSEWSKLPDQTNYDHWSSADEMLMADHLTNDQEQWLKLFIADWESMEAISDDPTSDTQTITSGGF